MTSVLPVKPTWRAQLAPGDRIRLRDTRDSPRVLVVVRVAVEGTWVEIGDTTYLASNHPDRSGRVDLFDRLAAMFDQALLLKSGAILRLTG